MTTRPLESVQALRDHLLRTFAAVPYGSPVLHIGGGAGQFTHDLMALGFDTFACHAREDVLQALRDQSAKADLEHTQRFGSWKAPELHFPDGHFDWVLMTDVLPMRAGRVATLDTLREARRVLRDGGWLYLAQTLADADDGPTLAGWCEATPLAIAERHKVLDTDGVTLFRAIYRRVASATPG